MAKFYVSKKDKSVFERFIDEATVNLSQHEYDSFIEDNVEHYRKAGIESLIIRRQLAKCCDWCAALAGTYEYKRGKYPSDIFRRHENCRCMVTCKQGKGGYQDVWTKVEYKTQREARAAREEEIEKQQKNFEKFERKKRIAKEKGEKFVDATEYWENKPKEYPAKVVDTPKNFEFDGKDYEIDGHKVVYKPLGKDKKVIKKITDLFGGKYQLMPKINEPSDVSTPDYMKITSDKLIRYDAKSLTGIGKNLIDNAVKDKKEQAHRFFIDVTRSSLSSEEIKKQCISVMQSTHRDWVEELVVIKGNKLLICLERI